MAAPIVYHDVAEGANLQGQLFAGKKFFLLQRIPSRIYYTETIKNNGGAITLLEKQADYLIADPFKKPPPGTTSYKFIDESVKKGELQDPADYPAGPAVGTTREVGSTRPTKTGRVAFTAEDDRILYQWVKGAEKNGVATSGNELYKQLEKAHPGHTWQSWRDRWIKQLKDRPPAAFQLPANAPPSPETDHSAERIPPTRLPPPRGQPRPAQVETGPSNTRQQQTAAPGPDGERNTSERNDGYSVEQLAPLFEKEDWEELYANAATIQEVTGGDAVRGWIAWATGTGASAEQWRQYFEKVVLPQWKKDEGLPRKRAAIEARVKARHEPEKKESPRQEPEPERDAAGSVNPVASDEGIAESAALLTAEAAKPSTPSPKLSKDTFPEAGSSRELRAEDLIQKRNGKTAQEAYRFFTDERRHALWEEHPEATYFELHAMLKPQWDALSETAKAPYLALEAEDRRRAERENGPPSESSTVFHQTPREVKEVFERSLKRIRGEPVDEYEEERGDIRHKSKRRRQSSSPTERKPSQPDLLGTQYQPVEISSAVCTSSSSDEDEEEEDNADSAARRDQDMEDAIQSQLQTQELADEEEMDEADIPTPTTESDDVDSGEPVPPEGYERPSSTSLPSNTPTPQPFRHRKPPAFDTQAILSSPSQGLVFQPLPRPPKGFTQSTNSQIDDRGPSPSAQASSPPHEPESEASTTHSLQEFRRSLNGVEDLEDTSSNPAPAFAPLPRPPRMHSVTTSEADSEASDDPDPPLSDLDELQGFLEEQQDEGFEEVEIMAALRHTGGRPVLACEVLDAWKDGERLPDKRGIWSEDDDEEVGGGNLIGLVRRHTMDGWGGVTERTLFLRKVHG